VFHLANGTQTSLLAKVNAAIAMLNTCDKAGAISTLNALINETRAQHGKKIPATQADVLIAFVQNVIASLP
jgi:carbamate kinase